MSISVIVGGQYGSEGKGKACLHFAREFNAIAAVKTSGTNAGHSVYDAQGNKHVFRVLPTACLHSDTACVIGPGAVFSLDLLRAEMQEAKLPDERLMIHPNAGIITGDMQNAERWSPEMVSIGSTASGTGAATMHRIARDSQFVRACEIPELDRYLLDTTQLMNGWLKEGRHIIVEGCQGFGLSIYHTPLYPYATSRDTTASAFVSEAGLSVFDVENVIQVLRTYEIRVAGLSGPMYHETSWEQVTENARSEEPIIEYTSVTKKVRRVGYFDHALVRRAVEVNKPNITVMNFMDYIGEEDWHYGRTKMGPERYRFIDKVEAETGCKVTHVGFGGDDIRRIEEAAPL